MTIMRRTSSKKWSERAAAAAATITELDDSALEKQIDVLDLDVDEVGDGSILLPTSKICENTSLRSV